MANRLPRHVGIIPDGNRRWAEHQGLPRPAGYAAGIEPGLIVLRRAEALGIEEVTAYGFTKENVRRPRAQVVAFQDACTELALLALQEGAALLAVGDTASPVFPDRLRPFTEVRAPGRIKFNILVNYSWQWDLGHAFRVARADRVVVKPAEALGSAAIGRIDLVIRWGGRRRLSGFLPFQCAYADFFTIDSLWPDMNGDMLDEALQWYAGQDVTLGG
ncbi:MAG: undecaprenyl diphosphate synthase family protein [Cyanobacteria bacterium]|nr:undecaprenyl diphosphate synthase family protein [Cyanobacteriota bacterium]